MRIFQFSVPRTGSTLMFNALRFACSGTEVIKTHNFQDHHGSPISPDDVIVATVRDWRDAAVSYHSTQEDKSLYACVCEIEEWLKLFVKMTQLGNRKMIVRYEDVYDDYDLLLDTITDFTGSPKTYDRGQFNSMYGVKRVKEVSDELGSFDKVDHATGVHGKHINHVAPGAWRLVPEHPMVFDTLKPYLTKFGY
jgi:hypothetical protein